MKPWKFMRLILLATTLSGVLVSLGYSLLGKPVASKQPNKPVRLASELPLSDWEFLDSSPLKSSEDGEDDNELEILGRQYRYQKQNWPLSIQMRYLRDNSVRNRDNSLLVQNFTDVSSTAVAAGTTHQQSDTGFYTLFSDTESAHLSTCINPSGGSTVTRKQFNQNRLIYDLKPDRLWGWVLGLNPLQDKRCLWAHLSIPLEDASPESLYLVLEDAWFDWYALWKPRFPEE